MGCSNLIDLEELDSEGELRIGGDGAARGAGGAVGQLGEGEGEEEEEVSEE